jgi:hypothetical protein
VNQVAWDVVLWIFASPIYFVLWLRRLCHESHFWHIAYTPAITCTICRSSISLVGMWRCRCGYTYQGHLLRACPVCQSVPRMARCFACGATEKLPEL